MVATRNNQGSIMELTDTPQKEFWFHVSDPDEIPIAGEVDRSFDLRTLETFLRALPRNDRDFPAYLHEALTRNIDLTDILRALVGVSDKRMYLELSYVFGRTPQPKDRYVGISGDSRFNLNCHDLDFFKNLTHSADRFIATTALNLIDNYLLKKGWDRI